MATKLDDLKFNDYTLKGTAVSGGGTEYALGTNDSLVDTDSNNIIYRYEGVWTFAGVADNAAKADQATVAGGIGNTSGCGSISSADVLYPCGSDTNTYWYFDGFSAKAYAVDKGGSGSALYYDTTESKWVLNAEAPSVGSSGGSALYYDGNNWVINATVQAVGSVGGGGGGSVLYYDWNDSRWVLNAEAPSVGSSGGSALYYDGTSWILNATAQSAQSVGSSGGSVLYFDDNSGVWVLDAPVQSVGSANGSALYYDGTGWILNGSASYANSAGSISGVLYENGSDSYQLDADTFVIQGTEYSLSVDPDGTVKATVVVV